MKKHPRIVGCDRLVVLVTVALGLSWMLGPLGPVAAQPVDPFAGRGESARAPAEDVISSVEFVDSPITTIFRMISDLTGWSILMSPAVTEKPPKINIWIKNLPADQVIRQVVDLAGLVADRDGQVVTVLTSEEYCLQFGVDRAVVPLQHARASELAAVLKPFVEKDRQNRVIADDRSNQIVLLLPRPSLESVQRLVQAMDVPLQDLSDTIRLVQLEHARATVLLPQIEAFLTQGSGLSNSLGAGYSRTGGDNRLTQTESATAAAAASNLGPGAVLPGGWYRVRFMVEPRLNAVVLRGPESQVEVVLGLIAQLDVPDSVRTEGYSVQYADPAEVYQALMALMAESDRQVDTRAVPLRMALSEQNARIVVIGTERDHARVRTIIEATDQQMPAGTGSVRVYRLENASAAEVAGVLQDLIGEQTAGEAASKSLLGRSPLGPAVDGIRRVRRPEADGGMPAPAAGAETPGGAGDSITADGGGTVGELPVKVVAAPEINAVIVRAPAALQADLEHLVGELDQARKQVMLEVTAVSVRSQEGFNLGLELAGARVNGHTTQAISLTQFGVGTADTAAGTVRLATEAPTGLNLAVFNAEDFSLVLNALKTVGKTRITTAPRVLVEDNAQATISQTSQEPFEITNQGETTTTTSFGGFVEAGTTLTVTPHLSDDGWIRMAYDVVFSSFGSRVSQALPPPRLQNAISGTVRVPAEHIVVLGGLASTRRENVTDRVPLLGDIPLLGSLFGALSTSEASETLFVFIRPVVLGDQQFEDLMALSEAERAQADLLPPSFVRDLKFLPLDLELAEENPSAADPTEQTP